MDGVEKSAHPYMICGTFYSSDWLTPVTYTQLKEGEDVTVARLSPLADKMLIEEGKIVRSVINPVGGVRNATYIKVNDSLGLYHKCADVGHHLVYTYGKHGKELTELCKNYEIEVL
jgi:L-fucose isomerase-like protein